MHTLAEGPTLHSTPVQTCQERRPDFSKKARNSDFLCENFWLHYLNETDRKHNLMAWLVTLVLGELERKRGSLKSVVFQEILSGGISWTLIRTEQEVSEDIVSGIPEGARREIQLGKSTDYRERQHCKHSKIMEGLECWEDISILFLGPQEFLDSFERGTTKQRTWHLQT